MTGFVSNPFTAAMPAAMILWHFFRLKVGRHAFCAVPFSKTDHHATENQNHYLQLRFSRIFTDFLDAQPTKIAKFRGKIKITSFSADFGKFLKNHG